MKSNIISAAAHVVTAPVILTGTAVMAAGTGMIKTGRALVTAGEATHATGARVHQRGTNKKAHLQEVAHVERSKEHAKKLAKLRKEMELEIGALQQLGVIDV